MVLDGIVAHNRLELQKRQAALPLPEVRRLVEFYQTSQRGVH